MKKTKTKKQEIPTNLGMGVMIEMLSGYGETAEAIQGAIGKTITKAEFLDTDNLIRIWFGKKGIEIWDAGQSCCENRYITTDDNIKSLKGKKFTGIEIAEAPGDEDDYQVHEVQFLRIHAEDEIVVFETHNEHNGYYGGFAVEVKEI